MGEAERHQQLTESLNSLGCVSPATSRERTTRELLAVLDDMLDYPSSRLAVYGTLAPGEVNHHVIADIPGRWTTGWVRGDLGRIGPYPALRWNPQGRRIPVHVLESPQLDRHWASLDRFEGPRYRRIWVVVETTGGELSVANLFEGLTLARRVDEGPASARR